MIMRTYNYMEVLTVYSGQRGVVSFRHAYFFDKSSILGQVKGSGKSHFRGFGILE